MNFCRASIGTTISVVNKVEAEGHEATTLLEVHQDGFSSQGISQKRGFLSASFCRPPVTLRLEFPLPIDISHIVLGPRVGQQVSTAFVLHTEITTKPNRSRDGYAAASSGPVTVPKHEIGKEYINDSPMPNLLVFRNPRFVLHRQFCSLPLGPFEHHRNYPNSFQLKHPTYDSCERVIALEVTIQRVSGFSVPALGSLSVWGQPGLNASRERIENLLDSVFGPRRNGLKRDIDSESLSESVDEEPTSKKSRLESLTESSVTVPDEFLDPITLEMMLQPVRLPCGIAIDSKTLEMYNKEEAIWGRVQNDPYTGVSYTETLRPIADAALKSRIDSFLTKNSNEANFKTLPRILGSGTEPNHGFGSSRISHLRTLYKNDALSAGGSTQTSAASSSNSSASNSNSESEESTASVLTAQDFMNQEMARILSATPYKSQTDEETANKGIRKCLKCETQGNSTEPRSSTVFYSSSCGHVFMCRACLIITDKSTENVCSQFQCGRSWRVSDLSRIFT